MRRPETLTGKPLPEVQIGGGDFLKIKTFKVTTFHTQTATGLEIQKLPDATLEQIREDLEGLPFSLGNKDSKGTSVRKNSHPVAIDVYPRKVPDNAPDGEKGKYTLIFNFVGGAWRDGLHLNTHNNLKITQERGREGIVSSVVSFSPDQPLHVAGKEIRKVALVSTVQPPTRHGVYG